MLSGKYANGPGNGPLTYLTMIALRLRSGMSHLWSGPDARKYKDTIYFPAVNGEVDFSKKYPVIMNRSGYMGVNGEDWGFPGQMQYYCAERGYVFILSGARGTFRSGGDEIHPLMDEDWAEHPDGVDVTNWIASQPWCDGRIATTGMSWLGNTQYSLWLADEIPESLVTSVITNPAMNSIDGGVGL